MHLLALFCLIFASYFVSKSLAVVQKGETVTSNIDFPTTVLSSAQRLVQFAAAANSIGPCTACSPGSDTPVGIIFRPGGLGQTNRSKSHKCSELDVTVLDQAKLEKLAGIK